MAARTGGDEFALLLPSSENEMPPVLQRFRVRISDTENAELSAGMAACPSEVDDADACHELADQRLYHAKRR